VEGDPGYPFVRSGGSSASPSRRSTPSARRCRRQRCSGRVMPARPG
jgi:hypothetical protein